MYLISKRDGSKVEFDKSKVVRAIERAMMETDIGVDSFISNEIANDIEYLISVSKKEYSVEDISDIVEEMLASSGRFDVSKKYILYRDERKRERAIKKTKYKFFTNEFLSTYKHAINPMTELGSFVYSRTYSRYLPEEKRREYWWETIARAVDYNCSLSPLTTKEEAEKLFDNIFNLKQFLSGRTFWVGGTEVSRQYPMSNYNCSFTIIDNFNSFKDLFYLLMIGAGVGVRILKSDVEKLPPIRSNVEIIHKDYVPVSKRDRKESTAIDFEDNMVEITVADSKEGWTQSLDFFLKILYAHEYRKIQTVIMNYDNVRPKGEKLNTFGGTASGHESIKAMFEKIDKIIKRENVDTLKLRPIHCLDIANIIGENVVVGGVRRTSEIMLIDADDKECVEAKSNLYNLVNGDWKVNKDLVHRQMSNNSIYYKEKPSRDQLHWQIEQMRYSGEPAWINEIAASKRRVNFNGVNPCQPKGEYILTKDGFRKIEEIKDHIVLNGKKFNSTEMFETGKKEVFEVELENGATIRMTDNHLITTQNGDVELKKLKEMDKVIVDYNPIYDTNIVNIDEYEKGIIAGWFLADGGFMIHHNEDDYCMSFAVGKDEFEFHKNIEGIIKKHYDENFSLKPHHQKPESCKTGRIHKKEAVRKFKEELSIKEWNKFDFDIYKKSKEFKLGFLRALFTCDGSTRSSGFSIFNSIEKDFLRHIQRLLIEFGIYSTITLHNKEIQYIAKDGKQRNNKTNWKISIYDTDFIKIGYLTKYKQSKIEEIYKENSKVLKRKKQELKIKSINKIGIMPVYDITVDEVHHYNTNGLVVHNCGEILLDNNGLCNLTTVNVFGFVKDGKLDKKSLLEAQRLSAMAGYRMTIPTLELPHWNTVQQRDKLIGCSLTGWQDMVNATNMSKEDERILLQELKNVAIDEAETYAKHHGTNVPLLVTTLKPEGTLSQLPTVSSGVHYSHSPYYVRRVRVNAADPIVKVCEELKYPVFPEVGQTLENCTTKIVEFPVKSPDGKTKYDVSAIEQLENYKLFMDEYVQHNCSITVHVKNNEWDDVEQWVWDNWEDVVAVSFLSLDDSFYQLMPYESITEEEYNERKSKMKPFSQNLISKYEIEQVDDVDVVDDGCASGACPIR